MRRWAIVAGGVRVKGVREERMVEGRNEGKHQLFFQVMHLRIHSCPFNLCLLLYHHAFRLLMFTPSWLKVLCTHSNSEQESLLHERPPWACSGLYILLCLLNLCESELHAPFNYICLCWTNTINNGWLNQSSHDQASSLLWYYDPWFIDMSSWDTILAWRLVFPMITMIQKCWFLIKSNMNFTHSSNPTHITPHLDFHACLPLSELGACYINGILCSSRCVFSCCMTLKKAFLFKVQRSKWTSEARLKACVRIQILFFHHEVQRLLPFSFHLKGFCFHIWLIPDQSESPKKSSEPAMGRVTVSTTSTHTRAL